MKVLSSFMRWPSPVSPIWTMRPAQVSITGFSRVAILAGEEGERIALVDDVLGDAVPHQPEADETAVFAGSGRSHVVSSLSFLMIGAGATGRRAIAGEAFADSGWQAIAECH